MWITRFQLFLVLSFLCFNWSHGVEKDITVECLESRATTINVGGVIANCASYGLTRTSTVGPWLFQMADVLQAVNVSYNHIKRVSRFPLLPRVLTLTLRHNSIREIEPLAFTGLENLQNLDLSFNRIDGESLRGVLVGKKAPERYEPLPIRVLLLGHNDISTLDLDTFYHLQYLRELHLDHNPLVINETFSQALRQLPELKILNLAEAGLTSLPTDAFSGLRLTNLLLNGNEFTQVPDLSAVGGTLRLLNINQNPISQLDASSFAGIRSVREIVASGMQKLSTIKSGTFSGLENIRVISCSYNPELVNVEEGAFWDNTAKHFTLQELYLNNNALPRIKKTLLPWIKMSKVTLDGNRWVCDCRLHWLANYLRNRNSTVDRLTEVKCWDPIWLNGTEMIFWNTDLVNRHENYPCMVELEEKRQEQELERIKKISSETAEGSVKYYHLIAIIGIIAFVILVGSVIAFNKYRNYRPIYNVEKMSSPMHNEMKSMTGTLAEKSHLVR
uniref:LRRCT domain-containing protein n=1 Tax=Graphocephala atropunctata TaxID=36148 RepID=A0A1B6LLP3_9HEMI